MIGSMPEADPAAEDVLRLYRTVLEWMARRAEPERVLADLCRLVAELIPGAACLVMELDRDTATLSPLVGPGLPEELLAAFRGLPSGPNAGSCGEAVRLGRIVVSEDTATDPRWEAARELVGRFGLRSCWSTPLCAQDGTVLGTFAISRDRVGGPTDGQLELLEIAGELAGIVVDRRRVSDELGRQQRLVDSIVEGSEDAIFAKDLEGRYLLANSALADSLGTTPASILGRTDRAFFEGETLRAIQSADRQVLESGLPLQYEFEVTTPGTGTGTYLLSKSPLRTPAGEIRGLIGIGRDVTDLRRSQQAVEEAHRLESLGVLAGGLAHDFNNLLTGVLGHAELALARPPGDPRNGPSLREISKAATRASELIDQLLAYAGTRTFEPCPIDLPAFVSEIFAQLPDSIARRVELAIDAEPDLRRVLADPSKLRQVLTNLLVNASESMAATPGRVTVSVRNIGAAELAAAFPDRPLAAADYLELSIVDEGCGMDAATVSRIFEPFFTTKFSGRGLGLAATRGIVDGHGGWIDVESSEGRGSRFTVMLPATDRLPEPQPAPVLPRTRRTVLVVDDEEAVLELAAQVLEERGFEVIAAGDARRGLAALAERGSELALLLLDFNLPDLAGREVVARIRDARPGLPVVITSGLPAERATADFGPAELAGFLAKPYRPAELLRAVEAALAGIVPRDASTR